MRIIMLGMDVVGPQAPISSLWAAPGMPRKIRGWPGKIDAPMLLRVRALPHMWRWGPGFVRNCAPALHHANARANLELAPRRSRPP